MSVPRYIATRVRPGSTVNAAFERVVVLFTDHEAALAAAATEHWLAGDKQGYDAGWNAALEAAAKAVDDWLIHQGPTNVFEHITALRRTPPQPEPCSTCGHTDDDICYREDCPAIDRLIEAGP